MVSSIRRLIVCTTTRKTRLLLTVCHAALDTKVLGVGSFGSAAAAGGGRGGLAGVVSVVSFAVMLEVLIVISCFSLFSCQENGDPAAGAKRYLGAIERGQTQGNPEIKRDPDNFLVHSSYV